MVPNPYSVGANRRVHIASSRLLPLLVILLLAVGAAWRAAPPVLAQEEDMNAAEAALANADALTSGAGAKKPEPAAAVPAPAAQPAAVPGAPPTPAPTPASAATAAPAAVRVPTMTPVLPRPPVTPGPAKTPAPASAAAPAPATTSGAGGPAAAIRRNADGDPVASLPFVKPAPLTIVLKELSDQTGVHIETDGKMPPTATASGDDVTVASVLSQIASANKLYVVKKPDGSYWLMDDAAYKDYQTGLVEQKIFQPQHIDAKYFGDAIQKANILTKGVGSIQVDSRTNQVILVDLPEVLARAQDLLDLMDVALYTRVFYIKYADLKTVVDKIKQYKSDPGTIEVDEKGHLIIVQDVLTNIQRMESMIDLLDTRQMRRVYNLNSIDVGGKELDALQKNLDNLITKDAYYYIDEKRGLLILEDTPEKQEDVLKFLKVFNRTVDQVQVQAELLDVSQNVSLQYGTKVTYSNIWSNAVVNLTNAGAAANPNTTLDYKMPIGVNGQVQATLTAMLSDINTRVLMRPRLMVKNGEKANVVSGNDLPIVTTTTNGYGTGVSGVNGVNPYQTTSQQYVTSGLTIDIEPKISPTGLVEVNLAISNSSASPVTVVSNGSNNTAYSKATDSIKTTLIIPDGETRSISGLIRQNQNDNVTGIPVLCKIPWIGPLLFGSKDKGRQQRDLVFFITPTIVREQSQGSLIAFEFDKGERPDFLGKAPATDLENATYETKPAKSSGEVAPELRPGPTLFQDGTWLTSPTVTRRFEAPLPTLPLTETGTTSGTKKAARTTPSGDLLAPNTDNSEKDLRDTLAKGGGDLPASKKVRTILGPNALESAQAKPGTVAGGTTTPEAGGTKPTPTPAVGARPTPPGAKPSPSPTPPGARPGVTPMPTPLGGVLQPVVPRPLVTPAATPAQ
jgi:type II secretory pathway component GspD/PulD (secretin)